MQPDVRPSLRVIIYPKLLGLPVREQSELRETIWRQQRRKVPLQLPPTLRDRDAALEEHSTQLVDQRRSLANKPIAHPVQCLHVQLFLTL